MAATIIAVVNQKGGAGKTTLAMLIAGTLGSRGSRVLVADTDPQGTACQWSAGAPDETPFPATVVGLSAAAGKVHNELRKHVENYDYIVVDTPPAAASTIAQSALLVADLALVPVIPSPPDLWASTKITEAITNAQAVNETLIACLVMNSVEPNTQLARAGRALITDKFEFPLLGTIIHKRQVYKHCAAYGQPIEAQGKDARTAVAEIQSLVDELLVALNGSNAEQTPSTAANAG